MIWFMKLIRILLAAIDIVVYWLLELVYSLFIAISSAGIFSQATIQSFATRIYVFLGLIMVFKVSISLVTYIMNPDNFSKGDVGAPALLKGFIFALVGIVLVPYAFEIAYSFQRVILKENVIGNLILGMGHAENSKFSDNFIKTGGKYMADTVYNAFYRPNKKLVGDECLADPGECDMSEYFESDVLKKYEDAYGEDESTGAPLSVVHRLDWDILNATTEKDGETIFVMDYTYLITTLIGGFITYILLLFCIDIAVRSVKLCFLQLIAPIPLISKVDPKKGDKVFGNWLKECTSTYLDVFMRLLAIYFALFIISSISLQPINMVEGGTFDGFLGLILAVFLIIGTLNFARELPKLIGGIFGIDFKGMGGFTLNPAKKLGATPLIGGALVGAAGLAGRSAGQLAALGGDLIGKTAPAQWLTNKAKDIKDSIAQSKVADNMRKYRDSFNEWDEKHGGHLAGIGYDAANTAHGIGAAALQSAGVLDRRLDRLEMEKARLMQNEQKRKDDIAAAQAYKDSYSKMEDRAWELITSGKAGKKSELYREAAAALEAAKAGGSPSKIAAAQTYFDNFKKNNLSEYMNDEFENIRKNDATFDELAKENKIAYDNYYANSKDQKPEYSHSSAEQLSNNCKEAIHTYTMGNAEIASKEKARMADIDVEQQKIKEDIKSSKPYMPFPGGRK